MNKRLQSHFFWGQHAPLSTLTGAGLIILASTRLAYAIFCLGALFWIYGITGLVYFSSRKIMPKKGKLIILVFLSSFATSIYLLLTGFLNPLLVSGTWFFIVLIPPCCIGSGLFEGNSDVEIADILPRIWLEAACLALIIIGISLIREPLGLGSLSMPGGPWGIFEIYESAGEAEGVFPIGLLSVSGGGFLLLGFFIALFRYLRNRQSVTEDEQ